MAKPNLFDDKFYAWLEANGVTFTEEDWARAQAPLKATIDLNKLKTGVAELIWGNNG